MSDEIQERGPWKAVAHRNGCVAVISDDIPYDAMLSVSGNFEDQEDAFRYVKEIARRLNQWQQEHSEK